MQLLIDTHILIWFLEGKSSLSAKRKLLIVNGDNSVFISIASLWEIAIKVSLSKLDLSATIPAMIERVQAESIEILAITPDHILKVSKLPFHHRDPFDRMIIAQALVEDMPLISTDSDFTKYGVTLL